MDFVEMSYKHSWSYSAMILLQTQIQGASGVGTQIY